MAASSQLLRAASECAQHFDMELKCLQACEEALQWVRRSLRDRNNEELLPAIAAQEETEHQLEALRDARAKLVDRLSTALEAPPHRATVGQLEQRLPAGRQKSLLQSNRRKLRQLARSVERLCRGNAALIAHRLDITCRLLHVLGNNSEGAYERSGKAGGASSASLIERQC